MDIRYNFVYLRSGQNDRLLLTFKASAMIVNLLNVFDLSSSVNNKGVFSSCDFVGYNDADKTNSINKVLLDKKAMDNNKFIEELRELLCRFLKSDEDIIMFSEAVNKPVEQIKSFIEGGSASTDFIEKIVKYDSCVRMGDDIMGDKIVFESGGTINKAYGDSSLQEKIKRLELENSDIKKLLKEKDKIIDSKDEIIEVLKRNS